MNELEWFTSEDPVAMLRWLNSDWAGGTHLPPDERKLRLFATACYAASYGHDRAVLPSAGGYGNWDRGEANVPEDRDVPKNVAESWCETDDILHGGIAKPAKAAILRDIFGNPFRAMTLPKCERCSGYKFGAYGQGGFTTGARCTRCGGTGSPWLTPTVRTLAKAAYEDRLPDGTLDPVTLLALADALEEAGCDGEECRECRGKGKRLFCRRCRGRWVYTSARLCPECSWKESDVIPAEVIACGSCNGDGAAPASLLGHLRSPGPHYRGCWAVDLVLGRG